MSDVTVELHPLDPSDDDPWPTSFAIRLVPIMAKRRRLRGDPPIVYINREARHVD
jgi:hypothetical protein